MSAQVIREQLTREEAERLTNRIALKFDSMADTYVGALPLVREAIERGAYLALGYRSLGEYVADRFGGALAKLGVEIRREVVRELTAAGLSTRAIAPVVGTSFKTVARDLAPVSHDTPEPGPDYVTDEADLVVNRETGYLTASPANAERLERSITGLDGKTYQRHPKTSRERPDAALSLVNDVRLYLHTLATSPQVAELSPTAKSHIITALQDAIDTLKGMS